MILRAFICAAFVLTAVSFTLSPAALTQPAQQRRAEGEARWVEETLQSLSLRERLGQMLMTPVQVEQATGGRLEELKRELKELGLGGVVVRGGTPETVAALTNEVQRAARVPLFVGADYERGLRMQMKSAGTPFTNNMGVAAAGDPRAAFEQAKFTAQEARAIGVNWLFGPVADLNNNPDNPVISIRSFGEDPRRVGEFVAAAVRGTREGGALSTAKHFPGHGDTAVDSHIGLPTIGADRARLDRLELVPFRAAVAAGVDSVMTAHIALPKVTGDELPATLSPKVTTEILRRELRFDGLVVTDSLGMGAITKGFPGGEASVRAILAGADVALTPPELKASLEALEEAVKANRLTRERVDESVRRILRAKYRLGLAERRTVDAQAVRKYFERPEAVASARRVAERSITLLRDGGGLLPLDSSGTGRTAYVIVAADEDPEEGRTFIPQIQSRVPGARILRADPKTTAAEYDALLDEARRAETIIVAAFVKRAAGKGTVALPERQADFVRRLILTSKPVAVVAFSGPYLVRQFPHAAAFMVAYGIEDVAQEAAARVLFGDAPARGRLPVTVPGLFAAGAGIQTKSKAESRPVARR